MRLFITALAIAAGLSSSVQAALVGFTDVASFNAAILGTPPTLVNFDSSTVGTTIGSGSSLGGIQFTYSWGAGVDFLSVNTGLPTSSGPNYLGTTIGAAGGQITEEFNDFDMTMLTPSRAVGLSFITTGELFTGDISLRIGGTTIATIDQTQFSNIDVDNRVYFLGIVQTDPSIALGTIEIRTPGLGGAFGYRVDDIRSAAVTAVPEPSSLAFCLLVATGSLLSRRRRPNR